MLMSTNYEITGNKGVVVVISTALGSTYAEWRPIVSSLSHTNTVLLYDRAGYGKSSESNETRSPKQIANELNQFLNEVTPGRKYLMVGHSFGGLIVQQFCRDFPEDVIGCVFLDPATTEEVRFRLELSKEQFKKSGIDKKRTIKLGLLFGKFRLLKLFKPLFKKSIPFYYYNGYDEETKNDILQHLCQPVTYRTMWKEYENYQNQKKILRELTEHPFPQIPTTLIIHSTEVMVKEIVEFGGSNIDDARNIDALWKEIMTNHYSKLSNSFKVVVSEKSGHFIHLSDSECLLVSINEIITAYNTGFALVGGQCE